MSDLNNTAAKLMGWVWVDEGDKHDWPLYYRVNNGIREFVMQANDFDPMHRWDHAGMLVEKMGETEYVMIGNSEDDPNEWCVSVSGDIIECGDTIPEAITRAFIKAMEAK